MIRLPKDVEKKLQKKYPKLNIKNFVRDLFTAVMQKSFDDGACTLREFGSFFCFKTFSSKDGKDVVRFKFRTARSLIRRLKEDKYLLKNVKSGGKNTRFNEDRIDDGAKKIRSGNQDIKNSLHREAKNKTTKNAMVSEIYDMIEKDDE